MAARIIGIGQRWTGDDGVGLAVIRGLREAGAQADLVELGEPSRLIELLTDGADPVVVVDAVLDGGPAGRVLFMQGDRREPDSEHLLSTHGVSVMDAIELARITHPGRIARAIFIVGITITTASHGKGLSRSVRAAVTAAARRALNLARSE